MADAKKCDRCGIFFERNTVTHDGDYIVCTRYFGSHLKVGKVLDLCDACSMDLKQFMELYEMKED